MKSQEEILRALKRHSRLSNKDCSTPVEYNEKIKKMAEISDDLAEIIQCLI